MYEKQTFVDNETVLTAAHLQHMEDGIARALSQNSQAEVTWESVKNKPFYEEVRTITDFEEQTLNGFAIPEDDEFYNLDIMPAPFSLTAGQQYRVMWDSNEYICTAQHLIFAPGAVFIGNGAFLEMPDTGEPFAFFYMASEEGTVLSIATHTEGESHTVGVSHEVTAVKTLEEKFLPDTLATKTYVETFVENYISEAIGGDY